MPHTPTPDTRVTRIPAHGRSRAAIDAALEAYGAHDLPWRDGGTFAYVMFAHAQRPRTAMGFCGAYFAAARTGQDNRGGIVIHEVSHWSLNARDAEYQPRGAQDLAKDEPHVAAMNADNYEYFAEFMPR